MNFPAIHFIEVVALILFILGLAEACRRGESAVIEFLMIFIYGIILEEMDMRIFKSYHYNGDFFFTFGHVPLCIPWLWAVILSGCMRITDTIGLPEAVKPFMDALLAVWLDLAIDPVTIRMGYWKWNIPLYDGWYGVPAGNLYAWMWVAFAFSLIVRTVHYRMIENREWRWAYPAVPFVSYLILLGAMTFLGWLGKTIGLESQKDKLYLFATQFFLFLIVVTANWKSRTPLRTRPSSLWFWSRLGIYFYFLLGFFFSGMHREELKFGQIAGLVMMTEIIFFYWIRLHPISRTVKRSSQRPFYQG